MGDKEEVIVAQKKLSGDSKYNVCFECLDRTGKDYKELQPMFYVTTLEEEDRIENGEPFKKKIYENHYFCPICKKRFSVNDFRLRYTRRADMTRWTEPPRMKNYVGE